MFRTRQLRHESHLTPFRIIFSHLLSIYWYPRGPMNTHKFKWVFLSRLKKIWDLDDLFRTRQLRHESDLTPFRKPLV